MTIELIPKNPDIFILGVSNGCWFTLCTGALQPIIGKQTSNDPIDVDPATALKCADAIDQWCPPPGWWREGSEMKGKSYFYEFFETCGGFITR